MPNPMRSWMFLPGNIQRFLDKIADSDADCIFLDLEDGVLPDGKADAREMVTGTLTQAGSAGPSRFVRINAVDTPWFEDDINAVLVPGLDGLCVPKVDDPKAVMELSDLLDEFEASRELEPGSIRIIAAIESAKGLLVADKVAASHRRVLGLMFGAEDFALDIGLGTHREAEAAELLHARSTLIVAAASAHVLSIDGVFPDLENPEGLHADVLQARRLGFGAKSTFNPRQIDVINRIFSPQPDEIEYAERVVNAFQDAEAKGEASVTVGGQLVDLPILRRAQRILELIDTNVSKGE